MAFDIGAGLSEAGKGIAQTAQAYTLESQKAELEQQKVVLADQLAGAREEKQRGFLSGESEKERGFKSSEGLLNRTSEEKRTAMSTQATVAAAGASAAAHRYSADRQFETAKAALEQGKIPAEVNLAKFITDPATTPEQRALVIGMVNAKNDKKETFTPLSPEEAKSTLGEAYDSSKAYQRGSHGKIEPIGSSLVNINNQTEAGFTKTLGEQDAKRIGEIQDNTKSVLDTAAKMRQAVDLLAKTYTGPGGQSANEFFKILGTLPGFEKYAGIANAGTAAQAVIAELLPKMRVAGSGTSSDRDMRTFAQSLPSLLNLQGGNELIVSYLQKIAERSMQMQGIAEKYARENKALTGTDFSKDVASLGPIFSNDDLAKMQGARGGASPAATNAPRLTEEEYRRAPSGTIFTAPDGTMRTKP